MAAGRSVEQRRVAFEIGIDRGAHERLEVNRIGHYAVRAEGGTLNGHGKCGGGCRGQVGAVETPLIPERGDPGGDDQGPCPAFRQEPHHAGQRLVVTHSAGIADDSFSRAGSLDSRDRSSSQIFPDNISIPMWQRAR